LVTFQKEKKRKKEESSDEESEEEEKQVKNKVIKHLRVPQCISIAHLYIYIYTYVENPRRAQSAVLTRLINLF